MRPFAQREFLEPTHLIGNEAARGTEYQSFGGSKPK
jgi:hypothetical protein